MMWTRVSPPSASDLALLKKPFNIGPRSVIPGLTEKEIGFLNAVQVDRLVSLRGILQSLKTPLAQGEFSFSLESLKDLHTFIDKEKNVVQRVAFKNMLAKIKSDLVVLGRLQEQLSSKEVADRPESWKERLHDEIEDLGEDLTRGFVTLVTALNQSVQTMRGLASSSLYRASLSSERQMYAKLEREGPRMLRRWNDVRLEVSNLLATRNHDPKSKSNLERMEADLVEILGYLDEYAIIPWLAGRDVVAAITILDRRLENYQDEYNLAQTDADRIANIIEDREKRDDNREKFGEKTINFLNYLGVSRNLSVGGAFRLARGTVRALSGAGKFVFRTLPNTARLLATSARTLPQRAFQTVGQLKRMVKGTLFGGRGAGNTLNVRFDDLDPESTDSFNRGLAGYGRSDSQILPATPISEGATSDLPSSPLSEMDKSLRDEVVSQQSGYPGSTAPVRRLRPGSAGGSGNEGLRSFLTERFDRLSAELRLMWKDLKSAGPLQASTVSAGEGGEAEALRKEAELDTLKAIQVSLERLSGSMNKDSSTPAKASLLSTLIGKISDVKGWIGGVLQALGGWKLLGGVRGALKGLFKGISTIGRPLLGMLASGFARMAGPLLRMGSVVARLITGPVGMVLGSGLAGWEIGSAIYEKFGMKIGDVIDSSIEKLNSTLEWIRSRLEKISSFFRRGKEVVTEEAVSIKNKAVISSLDREMKQHGGITSLSRSAAEAAGVDTSSYPSFSLKDGVTPAPVKPSKAPSGISSSAPTPTSTPTISSPSVSSSSPLNRGPSASLVPPTAAPRVSTPTAASSSISVSSALSSTKSTSASPTSPSSVSTRSGVENGSKVLSSGSLYTAAADANMEGLQPSVRSNFEAMVAEYKQRGGTHNVRVNRAFATFAQQQAIFEKYGPGRAARPGNSAHNYGIALDIDRGAANEMSKMGLLAKYGFERPVNGEPWHLQVAGVSAAMAKNGVFSADDTSKQGDRKDSSTLLAANNVGVAPSTQVVTQKGSSPEKAAYSPVAANTTAMKEEKVTNARSGVQATPAGHGTARVPEFSWNDPSFFALNLGALVA